jgi:hypothetical protein
MPDRPKGVKNSEDIAVDLLDLIMMREAVLGCDPELPLDAQELHEMRWFPIQNVQDHLEVSRVLDRLE